MKVLSFGGGVNSMAILTEGAKRGDLPDRILFADTGAEWPETLEYLGVVARPYAKSLGLDIETVRSEEAEGSILKYCRDLRTVPVRRFRWCTRIFKVKVLIAAVQDGDCQWVGIDAGETHRAKEGAGGFQQGTRRGITVRYPLIEWGLDRDGCKTSILNAGLPVPIKSGCFICPFARRRQYVDLARRHPELFQTAVNIEEGGARFSEGSYLSGHKRHGRKPLRELVTDLQAKQGVLFEPNQIGSFDEDLDACAVCEVHND